MYRNVFAAIVTALVMAVSMGSATAATVEPTPVGFARDALPVIVVKPVPGARNDALVVPANVKVVSASAWVESAAGAVRTFVVRDRAMRYWEAGNRRGQEASVTVVDRPKAAARSYRALMSVRPAFTGNSVIPRPTVMSVPGAGNDEVITSGVVEDSGWVGSVRSMTFKAPEGTVYMVGGVTSPYVRLVVRDSGDSTGWSVMVRRGYVPAPVVSDGSTITPVVSDCAGFMPPA